MAGIKIRHTTLRSSVALVPLLHKPFSLDSIDECPSCHLVHPVKVVHLWLDDAGGCIVSQGVLDDLRRAGMPDLVVENEVTNPPALDLGVQRAAQDKNDRRIIQLTGVRHG